MNAPTFPQQPIESFVLAPGQPEDAVPLQPVTSHPPWLLPSQQDIANLNHTIVCQQQQLAKQQQVIRELSDVIESQNQQARQTEDARKRAPSNSENLDFAQNKRIGELEQQRDSLETALSNSEHNNHLLANDLWGAQTALSSFIYHMNEERDLQKRTIQALNKRIRMVEQQRDQVKAQIPQLKQTISELTPRKH